MGCFDWAVLGAKKAKDKESLLNRPVEHGSSLVAISGSRVEDELERRGGRI